MSKSFLETNKYNQTTIKKESKFSVNKLNSIDIRNKEISEEKIKKRNTIQVGKNQKYNVRSRTRQGFKKGQWTIQEDKLLEQWIKENGPRKWNQCGRFIQGRSGKQCREHWNNCLNPELIKGEWTSEEDFLIMYFYEQCNGSWKKIIPLFNGRTENSIKNRFFSQLRKIATKNMSIDKRKDCSKIKLEELKKYLNKANSEAKKELVNNMKMNEEEFKNYIDKMKMKIQKKCLEENENSDVLSTNLGDLENIKNNLKENNENEINFICKKKRAENRDLNNVLSSLENESKNTEVKEYEQKLSDNKNNNNRINDTNIFTEQLDLKTGFNIFDNGNNLNFNYVESVYNNNDKLNNYSITQTNSQLLNIFNNNNNLSLDFDCYKPQFNNKEDFALFSFDSIPNNFVDYPFNSKLGIDSINDIFNNDIDLFEEKV